MDVNTIELFFEPKDRLRMTWGDRSYPTVKPAWSAPLSHPGRYLSLLNAKGEEIAMVLRPEEELHPRSLEAAREELSKRYLTATILEIEDAKTEFGATYWHVRTERGQRDFVTQSLQENAQWLGPRHLLLIDVDGNRFEVRDVDALDPRSRLFVETIL